MILRTPGVTFLTRAFVSLLLPCTIIALVRLAVAIQFNVVIPVWALFATGVLSLPFIAVIRRSYTLWYHSRRASALGARLAPCVRGKWIGNLDVLISAVKKNRWSYPGDGHWEWMEKLGQTFNLNFLWDDIIVTYEPDNIKAMLATDFPNFVKGDKFQHSMSSVLGSGVFNSDNDMWKFHRSMTRPFFNRDRVSDFDNFERHADTVIQKIKERFDVGYSIDFQDVISRFSLDSASDFLFGKNVHSLGDPLPYPHNAPNIRSVHKSDAEEFSDAFADAQSVIAERFKFGWLWPLTEIFEDKTKESMKITNAFLDPIVQDAIKKHKSKGTAAQTNDVAEGETLLDHLVNLTTDRTALKDEILNIMIAGRDTTASTLTFIFYLLAEHPTVLARLREEILGKVGPSARPTLDDIRDMRYLRAVINETLRLFPAVPFNVREAVHETTWPSQDKKEKPIYIPAGANTMYSVFVMHRRTDLWGPDALEFDPDRFIDERQKKYLSRNPFIFLPFNAGPRICLGQQFAYNEMSFMIIRLLQSFSSISLDLDAQAPETRPPAWWATMPGRQSVEKFWPKAHLTMYSNGGVWVKMGEADRA